ncbi:integrase, partial [Bordetella avium]
AETLATKTDVAILKWMVGFNLAFTMAMLWKIFS